MPPRSNLDDIVMIMVVKTGRADFHIDCGRRFDILFAVFNSHVRTDGMLL